MSAAEQPRRNGVLKPCTACKGKRETLEQINKLMGYTVLTGTEPDKNGDPDLERKNVSIYGPFRLTCERCHDTGFELTLKAKRLIGLVKLWWDDCDRGWATITDDEIEQEETIPF